MIILYPAKVLSADTPIPYLERIISISFKDERLDEVLKKIEKQGRFIFSYNADIIDKNKIVTNSFVNKTIREILDQLFNGSIQYKARGKYIILTKAQASSSDKDQKILSGYVVDEATGER